MAKPVRPGGSQRAKGLLAMVLALAFALFVGGLIIPRASHAPGGVVLVVFVLLYVVGYRLFWWMSGRPWFGGG